MRRVSPGVVGVGVSRGLEGKLVDLGVVEPARAAAAGGSACCGRGAGERALTGLLALVEPEDGLGGDVEGHSLLAVVGLVLAGPEAAVDEDAAALAEVLRRTLAAIAPDAHAEPVRGLDPLTG